MESRGQGITYAQESSSPTKATTLDLCSTTRALDSDREPLLDLAFDPSNGAKSDFYTTGKTLLSLQLIDHRSAQASYLAELRQTKYLKRFD
jgi:hypothetical protein